MGPANTCNETTKLLCVVVAFGRSALECSGRCRQNRLWGSKLPEGVCYLACHTACPIKASPSSSHQCSRSTSCPSDRADRGAHSSQTAVRSRYEYRAPHRAPHRTAPGKHGCRRWDLRKLPHATILLCCPTYKADRAATLAAAAAAAAAEGTGGRGAALRCSAAAVTGTW